MQVRNPASAPNPGDRVPYVITQGPKGKSVTQCAEDPLYVLENDIAINYKLYNDTQLAKPLYRLFQFFDGITERYFTGGIHLKVRARRNNIDAIDKTGLIYVTSCLACYRPLSSGLCCDNDKCREKTKQVCTEETSTLKKMQKESNDIWAKCDECAGCREAALECITRDCPLFYTRKMKKNQTDGKEKELRIRRICDSSLLDW